MTRSLYLLCIVAVVSACERVLESTGAPAAVPAVDVPVFEPQSTAFFAGNVTLVNSHWRDLLSGQDSLRTGQSLYLQTVNPALVPPDTIYEMVVENLTTGEVLVQTNPMSDGLGMFEMTPVLNDLGQEDGVEPGALLRVTLDDGDDLYATMVPIDRRDSNSERDAVIDPLVFASDSEGNPQNSFVVGSPYPHETGGPIYVSGTSFPAGSYEVDIYVVRDRDRWAGKPIPRTRYDGLMAKPVTATIVDGRLPPTKSRFTPTADDLGTYDVIVDIDRDGVFDYDSFEKDGVDGEARIGFTVQRSGKWLAGLKDKHLLVNLAYDSSKRVGGTWRNSYRAGDKVYIFVNPPVNRKYHAKVRKWIVPHRDFSTFWDNPQQDGTVPFSHLVKGDDYVQDLVPQVGCTNSPPVYAGTASETIDPETAEPVWRFDIVLDYDLDGRYTAGVDILDVMSIGDGAEMVSPDVVRSLDPQQQGGFRVQ